jgi:uncharacterized 2Fe-2S/4Fe-4S cluster protein (DUF4445 family)
MLEGISTTFDKSSLFLSLPPKYIRQEPYVSTTTQFPPVTARELGVRINPTAIVYYIPAVAAYLGGDITAGVLSSHLSCKTICSTPMATSAPE